MMTRTHHSESDLPTGKCGEWTGRAVALLDGRWKVPILARLFGTAVLRFSELQRALVPVSPKVLTTQLRELERDGLIVRTVYATVPPRVEYALSEDGRALEPALVALREWATRRMP